MLMIVPTTVEMRRGGGTETAIFEWDGEIHQEAMLDAFVVEVRDSKAHFVITHYDYVHDDHFDRWGESDGWSHKTASTWASWSDQFPYDYRGLLEAADREYSPTVPEKLDYVDLAEDSPELMAGDTIHIHELLLWAPAPAGSIAHKIGQHIEEICKTPTPNQSVTEFFARVAKLRPRIARQLVRSAQKREAMDMNAQNRILPNEPLRPFGDDTPKFKSGHEVHKIYQSRNVFGTERTPDHYVDVTARPAGDYYTELGGKSFHTEDGRHLFTPHVMPFGQGRSESSDDDPLYAIEISIHSETVMCPAISEQQVVVTIDGRTYEALQNPRESSRYFERPGHHVVMDGLREVGAESDTYEVTEEQSRALSERRDHEHRAVMCVIYEAINNGEDFARSDLQKTEDKAERRVMRLRAEANETNALLAGILGGEPTLSLSSGAHLLVPKSMLDAIEITLPAIE